MSKDPEREKFEKWISSPPFERETERWPDNPIKHAWPGSYKDYHVELAWEAWKAANDTVVAALRNPVAVHVMMLRGSIAWTEEGLKHLLGNKEE